MDFSNKSRNLQIGSYLQTLRLEQDLTLEQLSISSQVPIIHLTSIEEGHFSRFDDFYLKIYLKRFTESLDVDLDQLYAYASQQPLPDLPDASPIKKSKSQMTQMQADISAAPKNDNANQQRKKPTLKTANIASLEAKKRVGRFVIGSVFAILIILIVFFVVMIIRDLADRGPAGEETIPSIVTNPHGLDIEEDDENDDDDEENGDDEENDDDEDEDDPDPDPPSAEDETSIDFISHNNYDQTFIVVTSHEEIVIRIEHSGPNWIGMPYNEIFDGLFETTLTPNANGIIELGVGAVNNMEQMFINDVEVEFVTVNGRQSFIFQIEFE